MRCGLGARAWLRPFRTSLGWYAGTRLLLIAIVLVDHAARGEAIIHEFGNWDGWWYRYLALHGYPRHAVHGRSTLGFFPLLPIVMRAFSPLAFGSVVITGTAIAMIGGAIATVLVQVLATGWWGPRDGRRAAVMFCVFPGSVVFAMDYPEGLVIPLAAGCLLALQHRRWLLAGILAGIATAGAIDALALTGACVTAAAVSAHRARRDRSERPSRALVAPLLSLTGFVAVCGFLWAWAGSPLATFSAQQHDWQERADALALVHLAGAVRDEITRGQRFDLIPIVGLFGAGVLALGVLLLLRPANRIPGEALAWTAGIAAMACVSEHVAPNPRILITAFPAVLVLGRYARGWAWPALIGASLVLLGVLSWLTFVGATLTP